MSRPLRIQYPNEWYHVMNRGRRGEKIFSTNEDYWSFVDLLNELYFTKKGFFSEPRNVAVYLIRRLRNDTLKQVGDQFGIQKYSTVSSIVERVKQEIKVDNGLKNRVQKLSEKINKSQRQT